MLFSALIVASIHAGNGTTCAVMTTGTVSCWGQIFLENDVDRPSPTVIEGLTDVASTSADADICATKKDGTATCWRTGRLRSEARSEARSKIAPLTLTPVDQTSIARLHLGSGSWCALLTDGTVVCSGHNEIGQGGDGTTKDHPKPLPVKGLAHVTQLATSAYASCAVLADHTATCWGYNHAGELGDGSTKNRLVPTALALKDVTAVAIGSSHGCAIAGGVVSCWGDNTYGQLGDGTTKAHRKPAPTIHAAQLAVGGASTCAIDDKATLWCWGVAAGDIKKRVSPQKILDGVASVSVGGDHACALMKSGEVECWGENGNGQLGDGTTKRHETPAIVKL